MLLTTNVGRVDLARVVVLLFNSRMQGRCNSITPRPQRRFLQAMILFLLPTALLLGEVRSVSLSTTSLSSTAVLMVYILRLNDDES